MTKLVRHSLPSPGEIAHCRLMLGPVVQNCWIEVCSAGPDERVYFWIDRNLGEDGRIAKRPIDFTLEHRLEIRIPCDPIIESHTQAIATEVVYRRYAVNRVFHTVPTSRALF